MGNLFGFIIKLSIFLYPPLGHVDKVLITTCLGSRGLEKKIVVYISPENMGDFLAIVKEKNFIEVVSRSINQVRNNK